MGIGRYFQLPSPAPNKMSNSLPDLDIAESLHQHRPFAETKGLRLQDYLEQAKEKLQSETK
jgi:hypothetical protein